MKPRTFVALLVFALLVIFVMAKTLHGQPPPTTAQRFVRVGWDVVDAQRNDGTFTVIDTIKDTQLGLCRSFYRIEGSHHSVAVAPYAPVECPHGPVLGTPGAMSPYK